MKRETQEALEAYKRHLHEFHYSRGDAMAAVLTTHRHVSRTELTRAINLEGEE